MTTRDRDLAEVFPVGGRAAFLHVRHERPELIFGHDDTVSPAPGIPGKVFASPKPHGLALPPTGPHTRRHQPDPIASPAGSADARNDPIASTLRYLVLYSTIERKDTSGQLR